MFKTATFLFLLLVIALPAASNTFSFQGTFQADDQIQLFPFTVASNAAVVLKSLAYGGGVNSVPVTILAGGFDTFFSLYAGDGSQINTNDDGTCAQVHPGNSGCLDAYLAENLTAGAYTLALTQSGNTPKGNLSDGFVQEGQGNYTCPQGFCDVFGSQQNGQWAIEIDNVNRATQAPEPTTFVLGGVAILMLVFAKRMRWFANRSLLAGAALTSVAAFAQTVPLTQDAYFVPASPTNYGSATTVNVGGAAGAQALVQFDLTALPAGLTAANVSKATVTLFVSKVGAAGTVNVSVANGGWSEATVNGASGQPVPGAAIASGLAISSGNTYFQVDATAAVQSWISGAAVNNGFLVTPGGGGVNVAFDSKESTTTSHPASLEILLVDAGPRGATGPQGIPGAQGATGPQGVSGAQGATGAQGAFGAQGATGAQGVPGTRGAQGFVGPTGNTGAQGPAGPGLSDGWSLRTYDIPPGLAGAITIGCATGQVAVSGACGYGGFDTGLTTMRVSYSGVKPDDHKMWRCGFYNTDTVVRTLTYGVFCAPATGLQTAP